MVIIKHIFYWILYIISFIPKRDKKIWVFGANKNTFNDNAKYLFIDIYRKKIPIRAIWISRDKDIIQELNQMGYESYYVNSFKGIFYCLKAGISVFSHSFMGISVLCGGSKKIGLWHGIPLKKMGLDISHKRVLNRFKSLLSLNHKHCYDIFLSTSSIFTEIMQHAYNIPKEKFFIASYPRLQPIFLKNDTSFFSSVTLLSERFQFDTLRNDYKYRYLYVPTWRDDKSDILSVALPDLNLINKIMVKKSAVFIIKGHELGKSNDKISNFSNITFMNSSIDIYPFLPVVDCLVTDYSSIFFDYYLLNMPIIFYPFDKCQYLSYRGFYFKYNEVCLGTHVNNFEELCHSLKNDIFIENQNKEKISNLIEKFWTKKPWDDNSSLLNKIQNLV